MNNNVARDTDRYMSLPYTVVLKRDDDGDFVAKIQELQGCVAHGETEAEALSAIKEVQRYWLEEALESGQPIPEPESEEQLPSGKWVQRTPRSLHGRLTKLARHEGVSLNQLVTSLLTEAVALRTAPRDKTEPADCRSCPLNRSEIWDRALVEDIAWRVEPASPRQNVSNSERVRKLLEQSRVEHGNENKETEDTSEQTCASH
jgi:predicted RNase H-like HicB family nuclease